MKVQKLLKLAASCTTDESCATVANALQEQLDKSALKGKAIVAHEQYLEDENAPHVSFEVTQMLSQEYALRGVIEVRDRKLTAYTQSIRFLDKKGESSSHWITVDEEDLVIDDDETILALCRRMKVGLIARHAALLESVGLPNKVALTAATKAAA